MLLTDESDLGSTEKSTAKYHFGLAQYALQEYIHDITKELSSSPA